MFDKSLTSYLRYLMMRNMSQFQVSIEEGGGGSFGNLAPHQPVVLLNKKLVVWSPEIERLECSYLRLISCHRLTSSDEARVGHLSQQLETVLGRDQVSTLPSIFPWNYWHMMSFYHDQPGFAQDNIAFALNFSLIYILRGKSSMFLTGLFYSFFPRIIFSKKNAVLPVFL